MHVWEETRKVKGENAKKSHPTDADISQPYATPLSRTARSGGCCLRTAHPLTASTMIVHAIKKAVKPMVRVKLNMASRPYFSMAATVSLLLAMKIMPPESRQNEATISVGGRDGRNDVGGEM